LKLYSEVEYIIQGKERAKLYMGKGPKEVKALKANKKASEKLRERAKYVLPPVPY
jgi:hypothetical protein